jgi:hypothetical protein
LFVVDIGRIAVDAVWPSMNWLLGYKSLGILLIVFVLAAFFWRWTALLCTLYIAFFPLVVLFWKIPNLVVKLKMYRSWMFWMLLLNGFVVFFRNLRYQLMSKSLAVIAVAVILLTDNRFLLVPAAAVLFLLLLIAAGRVVVDTFQPSWFLRSQKKALELVTSHLIEPSVKWRDDIAAKSDADVLTAKEIQELSGKIQLGIVATHGLYLWAYKLQQYRERRLAFLFSFSAYAWLLVGVVVSFTLLNTAALKIDAGQYTFDTYPSLLAMTTYSLCTLALNDGGGVSPDGDISYLLRIAAGLFGVLFLGAFVLNLALTLKGTQQEEELRRTVADLRFRAHTHETAISDAIKVSFNEACNRFLQLGLGGMQTVIRYFQESIPPDFFEIDEDDSRRDA